MRRILDAGPISRARIAAETGLTEAAISRITRELVDLGLLAEGLAKPTTGRPGRPSVELSLPTAGVYVIGIGAGAFEQWIRVSTISGKVIARRQLHLVGLDGPQAMEVIADSIKTLLSADEFSSSRLIACGAAIAGIVSPDTGTILSSPNFGWTNLPFAEILTKKIGVATKVESLHHALNLAESRLGKTSGVVNVLLVNAALGIGASILADGRLIRGSRTAAGQIGHMAVDGANEICTCGRHGCLDTVASGHAVLTQLGKIPRRASPRQHEPVDARFLRSAMDSAAAGDAAAIDAFHNAGLELGKALSRIKMVTDPDCIVLAGPLAQVESYAEGTRQTLFAGIDPDNASPNLVISAQEMDAAGAWLALENFVFSERLDPSKFLAIGDPNMAGQLSD